MSADESTPGDAIRARRDATRAAARSGAGFLHFATTRPVAITMIVLATAVFGVVSFTKLPVDLLPEISYPTLTVRTVYPGGAPEDIEDRISERVQEALSTLPHLVRSTSISRAETSDVVLDFDWGTPMTYAVQDVRDKLDGVFLPQGAERPLILRYDPNLDPILRIGISVPENARGGAVNPARGTEGADGPDGGAAQRAHESELVHLRWIAENKIKRELESTPGIAAVQVRGGLQEEIRVRVDPFKMAAQNLDPALLGQRLAQENVNASGGLIREGSTEYLVRTLNEFRDVDEIGELAIVRRGNAVIRVKDVATVERTHAERQVVTRVDGREADRPAGLVYGWRAFLPLAPALREHRFHRRIRPSRRRDWCERPPHLLLLAQGLFRRFHGTRRRPPSLRTPDPGGGRETDRRCAWRVRPRPRRSAMPSSLCRSDTRAPDPRPDSVRPDRGQCLCWHMPWSPPDRLQLVKRSNVGRWQ